MNDADIWAKNEKPTIPLLIYSKCYNEYALKYFQTKAKIILENGSSKTMLQLAVIKCGITFVFQHTQKKLLLRQENQLHISMFVCI